MVRLATLLGLVCEKMAKRVVKVREEQQERKAAQSLARIQVNAVSEVSQMWALTKVPKMRSGRRLTL